MSTRPFFSARSFLSPSLVGHYCSEMAKMSHGSWRRSIIPFTLLDSNGKMHFLSLLLINVEPRKKTTNPAHAPSLPASSSCWRELAFFSYTVSHVEISRERVAIHTMHLYTDVAALHAKKNFVSAISRCVVCFCLSSFSAVAVDRLYYYCSVTFLISQNVPPLAFFLRPIFILPENRVLSQ